MDTTNDHKLSGRVDKKGCSSREGGLDLGDKLVDVRTQFC
jgi:hypothetical protein